MATICALVARAGGSEDQQVQAMSDRMIEYAQQCMKDKKRVSPFESRIDTPACIPCSLMLFPAFLEDAARLGMFFKGGVRE